jgi:hypothetical protein
MKAVRPVASRLRLRSSTARRGTLPGKRNETGTGRRGKPWRLLREDGAATDDQGTGGMIMFGTAPWGYGGYGQFHMVVWIILAIAVVAGVVWRLRSGSS